MKCCKSCQWWKSKEDYWGECLNSNVESLVQVEGVDSEELKQTFEEFGCIFWKQKMTKIEFEERYAKRSNLTIKELRELGVIIEPCDCGNDICLGWQAVTQDYNENQNSR